MKAVVNTIDTNANEYHSLINYPRIPDPPLKAAYASYLKAGGNPALYGGVKHESYLIEHRCRVTGATADAVQTSLDALQAVVDAQTFNFVYNPGGLAGDETYVIVGATMSVDRSDPETWAINLTPFVTILMTVTEE